MIELGKHLEVLLLSNDCVAVPDFGGFVAHYVPARIDEADGMFLPPMRTIGFNPHLTMNDSLLAQSYVEAYDISYPEALRMIEQETDEISRQLLHEGVCHLEGIGTLISNDEGNFSFEPQESGLLTPSLYGLSSYEFDVLKPISTSQTTPVMIPIQEDTIETEKEETAQQPLIELFEEENEENTIHIKISWVRNAIAIAAAIALFFLLTTPVANSDLNSQMMSTLQNNILYKLMPKDTHPSATNPIAHPNLVEKPVALQKIETEVKTDSIQPVDIINEEGLYCLVLASQVKQSNAEEFVRVLQDKGFKDSEVYTYNNVVRVVYGHFKSESAAYTELQNLRSEENFKEAWVFKRKNEG